MRCTSSWRARAMHSALGARIALLVRAHAPCERVQHPFVGSCAVPMGRMHMSCGHACIAHARNAHRRGVRVPIVGVLTCPYDVHSTPCGARDIASGVHAGPPRACTHSHCRHVCNAPCRSGCMHNAPCRETR